MRARSRELVVEMKKKKKRVPKKLVNWPPESGSERSVTGLKGD